jgi:hypothetical protein
MPLTIAQPSDGVTSSLDAGSVTSGAANQVVCDSGALGAGNNEPVTFVVQVTTFQTGTVDANGNNMLVNVGGTNTGGIISGGVTIGRLQSSSKQQIAKFVVSVQNGQHVYVCVGNTTPGASSVYNAQMSVTRSATRYPKKF